ncbi:MAG: hypothetical protein V4638_06600 [Bacteroidota bacterium]
MTEDPLDSKIKIDPPLVSIDIVKWWERKRWVFNVVLIVSFVFFTYLVSQFEMKDYVFKNLKAAFLIELVLGNIIYCFSWLIELMVNFYADKVRFSDNLKWAVFAMGLLITVIVSFFVVDAVIDFRFI